MPGVPAAGDQQLARQLGQLFNTVRGMASQQQDTISNLNGQPVLNVGLSPGSSPAQYGLQLVDPATGAERGFLGEDANGVPSLKFRDASGNVRVILGQLPNGDYGLQVIDASGNSEEILPAVQNFQSSTINVTSTTYVSSGGPSVTVVVGASGKVKVEASAAIESANASDGAHVGLFVDGTLNVDGILGCFSAASTTFVTASATLQVSGLTAGSHTFELRYEHTLGVNPASFFDRNLIITPL